MMVIYENPKGEFFIEWDDGKARKNISDHGINFFEASEVFEVPFVIQNTPRLPR